MNTVQVILGYKGVLSDLADKDRRAPIDHVLHTSTYSQKHPKMLPLLIRSLEHGINRLDGHGCTPLNALIDTSHSRVEPSWAEFHAHSAKLERYKGLKILKCQEEWTGIDHKWRFSCHPNELEYYYRRLSVSHFRDALYAASASAAQIRSSPCIASAVLVQYSWRFWPRMWSSSRFCWISTPILSMMKSMMGARLWTWRAVSGANNVDNPWSTSFSARTRSLRPGWPILPDPASARANQVRQRKTAVSRIPSSARGEEIVKGTNPTIDILRGEQYSGGAMLMDRVGGDTVLLSIVGRRLWVEAVKHREISAYSV